MADCGAIDQQDEREVDELREIAALKKVHALACPRAFPSGLY